MMTMNLACTLSGVTQSTRKTSKMSNRKIFMALRTAVNASGKLSASAAGSSLRIWSRPMRIFPSTCHKRPRKITVQLSAPSHGQLFSWHNS